MKFSFRFLAISIMCLALVTIVVFVGGMQHWFGAQAAVIDAENPSDVDQDSDANRAIRNMNQKMGGKETPIEVEAAPVIQGDLVQRITAQGRVYAYERVEVINEIGGRLTALNVADGQKVKKGQVLATIDDREKQIAVGEARSKLLAAQADYLTFDAGDELQKEPQNGLVDAFEALDRQYEAGEINTETYRQQRLLLELEELKSGSRRDEVITARTLAQAENALDRALLDLEKCEVRAPFEGVVFDISVTRGELLNPSTRVATLVNLDNLVVKGKVLESEIGQIVKGRLARIHFPALDDLGVLDGYVEAVSPYVNEEDKTVDTIIRFENVDQRVKPGMFAEVTLDARIHKDCLMVPKTAILPRDDRKVVFKISADHRAKWEYVTTGVENDAFVQILTGDLKPGDLVLTNNHFTMGHDTLVKVVD